MMGKSYGTTKDKAYCKDVLNEKFSVAYSLDRSRVTGFKCPRSSFNDGKVYCIQLGKSCPVFTNLEKLVKENGKKNLIRK